MDWKAMLNIGENSEINERDSLGDLGEAWPCRGRKIPVVTTSFPNIPGGRQANISFLWRDKPVCLTSLISLVRVCVYKDLLPS